MYAISRKSLTPRRSCCKTSAEKTRALAVWYMASQVFRSAPLLSWKSFSSWRGKRGSVMQGPTQRNAQRGRGHFRSRCLKVSHMALAISVMLASFQLLAQTQGKERPVEHPTFYHTKQIDGLSIFYREAG